MTALLSARSKKKDDEVYTGRRNPILLFLVFLMTGAAFWYHFEHRFANIERKRSLSDTQSLLNPEERGQILALRALLREKWGLLLHVRLGEAISVPPLPSNGLFVGVGNEKTPKIMVRLPALLEKAIGSDYGRGMESRLTACLRMNRVGQCLDTALLDMVLALEKGEGQGKGEELGEGQENRRPVEPGRRVAPDGTPPARPGGEVRGFIVSSSAANAPPLSSPSLTSPPLNVPALQDTGPNSGDSYATQ